MFKLAIVLATAAHAVTFRTPDEKPHKLEKKADAIKSDAEKLVKGMKKMFDAPKDKLNKKMVAKACGKAWGKWKKIVKAEEDLKKKVEAEREKVEKDKSLQDEEREHILKEIEGKEKEFEGAMEDAQGGAEKIKEKCGPFMGKKSLLAVAKPALSKAALSKLKGMEGKMKKTVADAKKGESYKTWGKAKCMKEAAKVDAITKKAEKVLHEEIEKKAKEEKLKEADIEKMEADAMQAEKDMAKEAAPIIEHCDKILKGKK